MSLTKLLIDSLNEKELMKGIESGEKNLKGIEKFELFLNSKNLSFPDMLKFIRNLQTLRSTSVAHRKSEKKRDYTRVRVYFELDKKTNKEVFEDILVKSIWILNSLDSNLLKKRAGRVS